MTESDKPTTSTNTGDHRQRRSSLPPSQPLPETDGWDKDAKEHPKVKWLHRALIAVAYLLVFLIGTLGCSRTPPTMQTEKITLPRTGVIDNYKWAIEPKDYRVVKERLKAYLSEFDPKDDEWEDAPHLRFVRLAKYSLLEAYYHLGELEAADQLLRRLMESDAYIK